VSFASLQLPAVSRASCDHAAMHAEGDADKVADGARLSRRFPAKPQRTLFRHGDARRGR
jgi:hypothetical protein